MLGDQKLEQTLNYDRKVEGFALVGKSGNLSFSTNQAVTHHGLQSASSFSAVLWPEKEHETRLHHEFACRRVNLPICR